MARVKPFRGISYDLERIGGDLAAVTTPPYDQINAAGIEAFHQKNDFNYIRLILARQTDRDDAAANRYTRARDTLKRWLDGQVLRQDDAPCFYVYRQTFSVLGAQHSRTGLMAAVHVEDAESGIIMRHERTLPKHVDDRLNLLRQTRTQFESIFLLYDDPQGTVRAQSSTVLERDPDFAVTDEIGTHHALWRLADAAAIQAFFADRSLLIADGHHRYQTTQLFSKETGRDEDAWVLATLYPVDDPGLVILPTHRVVKNVADFDGDALWQDLERDFVVEPWDGDTDSLVAEMRRRGADPATHVFGLYQPSRGCGLLTLRDENRLEGYCPPEHSLDWMKLDVAILHRLILYVQLGISMEAEARESNLEYHRWPKDAVAAGGQVVFFLNATRPTQVRDLASRGELMPQKSTDFYPKLLSGLVAFPLETVNVGAELSR